MKLFLTFYLVDDSRCKLYSFHHLSDPHMHFEGKPLSVEKTERYRTFEHTELFE